MWHMRTVNISLRPIVPLYGCSVVLKKVWVVSCVEGIAVTGAKVRVRVGWLPSRSRPATTHFAAH